MQNHKYIAVVNRAQVIGQLLSAKVYEVHNIDFYPIGGHGLIGKGECGVDEVDSKYIEGMRSYLMACRLYFSNEYDLTLSYQKYAQSKQKTKTEQKYMFNYPWIQILEHRSCAQWITPFISGYVNVQIVEMNNRMLQISLITRRDRRRQGMRYFSRGIDSHGYASNTCQTQCVLTCTHNSQKKVYSFVQLRGSMPFYWKQVPNLKFKPESIICEGFQTNQQAARKLYQSIIQQHESCTFVNLVDKNKIEGRLGEQFEKIHYSLGLAGMDFVWFDFHSECKGMKFQNVAKLIDSISDSLHLYGDFRLVHKNTKKENQFTEIKRQKGVIRTNCIDCLDRTNVVQAAIARSVMSKWLHDTGIINDQLVLIVDSVLRKQWTGNANCLSRSYSGTDAMKSDFTSSGKRTWKGALKDARIGVQRYFLGNFYDANKQNYVNFALGHFNPHQKQEDRIISSQITSFHILALLFISIPFLAHFSAEYLCEDSFQQTCAKAALSFFGFGILAKGAQLLHHWILPKPLKF